MATTDTWLGTAGDWSDAANWSDGVPGPDDAATFGQQGGISVSFTATDTIAELLDQANAGATLVLNAGLLSLTQGGTWNGVFAIAPGAELDTSGAPLLLGGIAALDGIIGAGTVSVTGSAEAQQLVLRGGAVLQDSGTIGAQSSITLGTAASDATTLAIGAGGTFDILGDFGIAAAGSATIANAGVFEKVGASGTSFINASLNNTGTLAVQRGTLSLDAGNDQLAGAIQGAGELDLRGGGTYALAPTLLSVGTLAILDRQTAVTLGASQTYAGLFRFGNFATLNPGGNTLTLTGLSDALLGTVAGAGAIALQGAAEANQLTLGGGGTLSVAGTVLQDGVVNLGTGGADSAKVAIAAGATWDILGDLSLNGFGNAAIGNAGVLEKTGGSNTSIIGASLSSTGTILAASGTISLFGASGSFSGALAGAGELDFRGGGQNTLAAGSTVTVGTFGVLDFGTELAIGGGLADTGRFVLGTGATLAVASGSFALAGTASLAGAIVGPGTVSAIGAADIGAVSLTGAAELDVALSIAQHGALSLGSSVSDAAKVVIESGATWDLSTDDSITALGAALIVNSGLFEKTGVSGISSVGATFDNNGTVAVERGTIEFTGSLDNAGVITVGGTAGTAGLILAGPVPAGSGSIQIGSGATVVLDVAMATGSIGFVGTQGLLELARPASTSATITGFAAGDTIDLLGATATSLSYANGLLAVIDGATTLATLNVPGLADPSKLVLAQDGNGGTAIELTSIADPPPTATLDNWVAAGGDWATAANWSLGAVPGPNNDAVIASAGTTGFTVTYNTLDSVDGLSGGTVASGAAITLAIGGGGLTIDNGGTWTGAIAVSGGTFDAAAGFTASGGFALGAGGVAAIDSGTLSVGGATLAGTVQGAGVLKLTGPSSFAAPTLTVATVDIAAAATLGALLSYAGNLVLESAGSLALNGQPLGLSGAAELDGGVIGPGTLGIAGTADLDGLVLGGGAVLEDKAGIAQSGGITIGNSGADASILQVDQGAEYDLLADAAIGGGAAAGVRNAGLLDKRGSSGTSTISVGFTNTGTLDVTSGTLALGGAANSLGGTVGGAGALLLGPGSSTLAPGLALSVGTLQVGSAGGAASTATLASDLAYAGAFALAAGAGTLQLGGHSLQLSGAARLGGTIVAATAGTLGLSGSTDVNGAVVSGPVALIDAGMIGQDGGMTFGAGASLQVGATATWDLMADVDIAPGGGAAAIGNAGLFEKTGAFGASTISGDFVNTGTILAQRGTLLLAGGTADVLGGTLAGAGQLALAPGGTATLQSGVVLSVVTLGIYAGTVAFGGAATYAGDFRLGAGATLTPNGLVLSGTASLDGVQNGGSLGVTGAADAAGLTLAGSATLDDGGIITQDGDVTLGTSGSDAAGIAIAAGATYDILANVNINSQGNAAIANAGLLEKTGPGGISYMFANLTNTGTIAVAAGTLSLRAGLATLGGTIGGAGEFDLFSTGTFTLGSGLALDVAAFGIYGGADAVLNDSRSYGGYFALGPDSTLALNGQDLTLSGTVTLEGTLAGPGTLDLAGSAEANGLALAGGAVLNIGASGILDVADGSTLQGALDNSGTIVVGSGTATIGAGLVNDGLLRATGGELVLGGSLGADAGRSGGIVIGPAGEVLLQGGASSAQAITFDGIASVLALAQPMQVGATLSGFQAGDTIDLVGQTFTAGAETVSFAGQVLSVADNGTTVAQLNLAGSYSAAGFLLADDGAGGTRITIPCFLAGTRLATPAGEVPVEQLAVGGQVLTAGGAARPLVWIGQRRIACARHPEPEKVLPVRIRAGAFAPGLPKRDLLLSPDHAVLVSGALIPVKHLVNGISIRQEPAAIAEYLHVELASHDVLLAEGLPVESYLDSGNRAEFANACPGPRSGGGGPIALHPRFAPDLDARRCAPLAVSGAPVATARRLLLARLAAEGYHTTTAADLRVIAAGRTLRPAAMRARLYRFILPDGADRVRIVSNRGAPCETDADSEDARQLGVAVQAILLGGRPLPLDHPALGAGFYGLERLGAAAWRWTDGDATLTIPPDHANRPARLLELLIRATARSWLPPALRLARRAA